MKTVFTLLLATVFTSAFAYDDARLTITVARGNVMQVYVDGRVYNENDNSTIVLNNIQPGNHNIRVYRQVRGNGGRNRNDRRNELVYSSTVYVRPAYHVDVMINRFGKALVDERALAGSWDDENWNGNGTGGYGNSGGYGNGSNGGYGNNSGYQQPMSSYEFDQLITRLKAQWFGSGRMTTAKDAFTRSTFTTEQVRQVLTLISIESDRLELVKLVYRNLVDQRNVRTLYDLFTFQSSREELDRYIREYR